MEQGAGPDGQNATGPVTRQARYSSAVISFRISSSVVTLSLISQPSPNGSSLTMPGSAIADLLTSTISPEIGMKSSETALTDSTVPNSSSAL